VLLVDVVSVEVELEMWVDVEGECDDEWSDSDEVGWDEMDAWRDWIPDEDDDDVLWGYLGGPM
jgi:hypothetical protein